MQLAQAGFFHCGDSKDMDPEDAVAEVDAGDDGFDDGFNNVATPPTETPETEAAEKPEAQPAIEYAQLTKAELDELKTRAALIEEMRATQDKSFGTAFGKIGGIERRLQEIAAAPSVEVQQADIDALKDDFPALATALEKVKNLRSLGGGVDHAKIDEMVQERLAPALSSIGTTVEQAVEKRLLSREHPDWQPVTQSEGFLNWAGKQPVEFQKTLADSWDSTFIGKAITDFKKSTKPAPTPAPAADTGSARRSRLSAAVTPKGSGNAAPADTDSDFDAGFKTG